MKHKKISNKRPPLFDLQTALSDPCMRYLTEHGPSALDEGNPCFAAVVNGVGLAFLVHWSDCADSRWSAVRGRTAG